MKFIANELHKVRDLGPSYLSSIFLQDNILSGEEGNAQKNHKIRMQVPERNILKLNSAKSTNQAQRIFWIKMVIDDSNGYSAHNCHSGRANAILLIFLSTLINQWKIRQGINQQSINNSLYCSSKLTRYISNGVLTHILLSTVIPFFK